MSGHTPKEYKGFEICAGCDAILCQLNRDEPCNPRKNAGAREYIDGLRGRASTPSGVEVENKRLRQAIRDLLNSADCEWENRNEGHDWPVAVAAARAILKGET